MNIFDCFSDLGITDSKVLTEKKQQTDKKIQYVSSYVKLWAFVMLERQDINTINFIDCMSNAGVYRDGDCCTAIEVWQIFSELADKYPNKSFYVFCNDNDSEKIEILRKIIKSGIIHKKKNMHFFIAQKDVNDYLVTLNGNPKFNNQKHIFGYGTATILYVDPFDFGTVEIPKVSAILQNHYCELIFNFFISDYVRNFANDKGRIARCLGGKMIANKDELVEYMRSQFKVGHIHHLFGYQFKTRTNIELYQIIFATPSPRGLEKLKEALWDTFDGAEFHRNAAEDDNQLSLFTADYNKNQALASYSVEAKELLCKTFMGSTVSWNELECFLIERTMLREAHILKHVLKPLIEEGKVEKNNIAGKTNYKKDSYTFLSHGENL